MRLLIGICVDFIQQQARVWAAEGVPEASGAVRRRR